MSASTLNDLRVTSARVNLPAWGVWYAEVQLDGEHTLTGRVTLKIADLTLIGTVLSGGPMKGRSAFRIAAGAGSWGRTVAAQGYTNDAGVKLSTVLGDAARLAGETLAPIDASIRVGPAWTRQLGPASRDLELLAPSGWYVDEAGTTRVGARAPSTVAGTVTRITPADLARGKVVLAPTAIAGILPGVVVDGISAVDVLHEIDAAGGLRSTVWGSQQSGTLDSMRALIARLDPDRAFRGLVEYRVATRDGHRLNLQAVRVSTGMPSLSRVIVRPGVSGCEAEVALASRVLVGFVDSDPARPVVVAFEDAGSDGFQPTTLTLLAGGMSGGEHVATVEATALLIYNTLVALMAAAGGGPLLAVVLQPLLATAVGAALAAQAAPAPPGSAAQVAAAAAQQPGFAAGVAPSNAMFAAWDAAIASLAAKTANASGKYPSIGSKAVEVG